MSDTDTQDTIFHFLVHAVLSFIHPSLSLLHPLTPLSPIHSPPPPHTHPPSLTGRAGVPMEVMGLMLGEFVDDYTVRVIDVFAMPQSGTVSLAPPFCGH